jgi:hypothetical protein
MTEGLRLCDAGGLADPRRPFDREETETGLVRRYRAFDGGKLGISLD